MIKLLVEHGADVNEQDVNEMTVLHYAAQSGNQGLVQWLADHGADVNAKGILSSAAESGNQDLVQWLEKHGAK